MKLTLPVNNVAAGLTAGSTHRIPFARALLCTLSPLALLCCGAPANMVTGGGGTGPAGGGAGPTGTSITIGDSAAIEACEALIDESGCYEDSSSRKCFYEGYRPYCAVGNTAVTHAVFTCLVDAECQTIFDPSEAAACITDAIESAPTEDLAAARTNIEELGCPDYILPAFVAHVAMAGPTYGEVLNDCVIAATNCDDLVAACFVDPENGTHVGEGCE